MLTNSNPLSLRKLLLLDAATCIAMGLLLMVASAFIASVTAIPATLLVYAGVALVPIAAFMVAVALRPFNSIAVWAVIIGNLMWVAASLWLLLGGLILPNTLGNIFISAQAIAVAALAILEYVALRHATDF